MSELEAPGRVQAQRLAKEGDAQQENAQASSVPGKNTLAGAQPVSGNAAAEANPPDAQWRIEGYFGLVAQARSGVGELARANQEGNALASHDRSKRVRRDLAYLDKLPDQNPVGALPELRTAVDALAAEAAPHLAAAFEPPQSVGRYSKEFRAAESAWREKSNKATAASANSGSVDRKEASATAKAGEAGEPNENGAAKLPAEIRGDLEQATGHSLGAEGRELIAHEVAHVEQANAHPGPVAPAAKREGESNENAAEREADGFAASFRSQGSAAKWSPTVAVTGAPPLRAPVAGQATTNSTESVSKPPTPVVRVDQNASTKKNAPELTTADGYLSLWATQLLEVFAKNAGPSPPPPHTRLRWTIPGSVVDQLQMWMQMERARFGADDRALLVRLLYPVDLYKCVDTYRDLHAPPPGREGDGPLGPSSWQTSIADVIAAEARPRWQESILRAGQRYVAAADELHASGVHDEQEIKRRLAANNAVLPHSPLDHIVLLVLRDAQMVKYTAPTTKAPREYAHNELKPLAITCMGVADPSLWNVVRVDSEGATVDQLAAVLFSQAGDAVAHSYSADMITVAAPFYILPPAWAATISTIAGHAGPAVYEPADAKKQREGARYNPPAMQRAVASEAPDPRTLLANSALADEIALAQNEVASKQEGGKPTPGAEHTLRASEAASLVTSCFDRVQYLTEVLGSWGLVESLEPVRAFLLRAREKTTRSEVLDPSWSSLLGRQGQLLWQISEHVASFVGEVGPAARGGDPTSPVGAVLAIYARAAGASHLVGVGSTLFVEAEKARQGVMLASVEFALRSSGAAVSEERSFEHQTRHVDADSLHLGDQQTDLKSRGAQMRNALAQGKSIDAGEAEALILEAEENRLIATISSLKLQFHEFKAAADAGTLGFIPGVSASTELVNMRADAPFLEGELGKIHAFLKSAHEIIYAPRDPKDANDPSLPDVATRKRQNLKQYVESAHAKLATLKQEQRIEEFLKRADQVLADQRFRVMIVSAAALIGVGLVTGGVASFVGGIVRGAMLAELGGDAAALASTVRTARAFGTAAELVTDATLSGVAQDRLMGGETSLAENLAANALTRFALQPLGRITAGLGEVDKRSLSAWERVGHGTKFVLAHGLQLSAEMITGTAISYAVHRIKSFANGEKPSDEMVDSWILQGASFAIGRYLNGRLNHQMQKLSELGQRAGRLPHRMKVLAERAAQLERTGSAEEALDVLIEHRILVAEEIELIGKLEREGKLHRPEAEALRADANADTKVQSHAFVGIQARAAGLDPVVEAAGRWAGDADEIATMVRKAAALDIDVAVIEPGSPLKRWKVKVGDDVLEIEERARKPEKGSPRNEDTAATKLPTSERLAIETDADGRIALAGDDALLRAAAARAQQEPGYVDVVVHADPDHFYIVHGGAEIAVSHRTVAKALEKVGLKKPIKIRLLACEGGKTPSAVAQHLANKTGLEVKAATDKVWVDASGTVGVGARDKHEGSWKELTPGTAAELESKRPLVTPEEGGRVDPKAADKDTVVRSEHDHRDRVEAWNHDQLQAEIGKPLVSDPTLGDGVRVRVRKTAAGYEVTAILHGPDARAVDVRRHADIVSRIERYNGLVGKLRSWKDSLFGKRAKSSFEHGSRGDRLHMELEKLEAHIRDTSILRSNDAIDAVRAREEIQFLTDAVNEIREQLDDNHQDLHAHDPAFDIARPGEPIGYVTQKAKAAGYKLPGEDGATHEGVALNPDDYYYRRNGDGFELARMPGRDVPKFEVVLDSAGQFKSLKPSTDERAQETKLVDLKYDQAKTLLFSPDASMDPYTQMLEHLVIASRADVDAIAQRLYAKQTMKGTTTIGTWRHAIKEHYRPQVEQRLYDTSLSDGESYRQLRDAVDLLANKDRAILVEGWYKARRLERTDVKGEGTDVKGEGTDVEAEVTDVKTQVEYTVTRASGKTETRQADFLVTREKVQGKEIVEVKDIDGIIDQEQFGAYADALRDDKVRAKLGAERMRYVFTKEAGARASLEFLADAYDDFKLTGSLTIEVYRRDGSVRTATNRKQAKQLLSDLSGQ